jgi:hypothetical protein
VLVESVQKDETFMDDHEVAADDVGTRDNSQVQLVIRPDAYPFCWRPGRPKGVDPVRDHRYCERVRVCVEEPSGGTPVENVPLLRLPQRACLSMIVRMSSCSASWSQIEPSATAALTSSTNARAEESFAACAASATRSGSPWGFGSGLWGRATPP